MMKKYIAFALALVMALSLTACGKSKAPEASPVSSEEGSAFPAEKADITLTVWGPEGQQEQLANMAADFAEAYADQAEIAVKVDTLSGAEVRDAVLADAMNAADLYVFPAEQLVDLVSIGALQPIELSTEDIRSRNSAGSVEAAAFGGSLYAYPMTVSDGYILLYDKRSFGEEDVTSLNSMLQTASSQGKKVSMELSGAGCVCFFAGAGLEVGLSDDGMSTFCSWNQEPGAAVVEAMTAIGANYGFVHQTAGELVAGMKDGSVIAGISDRWSAAAAEQIWGENFAAAKLPSYDLNGTPTQMSSFAGYQLMGVNPLSQNVGWAMILADWLTNEENQLARFKRYGEVPTNLYAAQNGMEQAAPAAAALAAQAEYAVPQRVGRGFWEPAAALGAICAEGGSDTDAQTLIDRTVEKITAPVG